MSLYSVIEKLGDTAVADVDIKRVPIADLKEVSRDTSPNGLSVRREYVYAQGAPGVEYRVISTINIDPPTAKDRAVRHNIRVVISDVNVYDSDPTPDALVLESGPVSANMGFSYPFNIGTLEVADLRQLLDNVFAFTFLTVTGGVPSSEVLTNFMYRIPDLTA